jgi:hypothetical protein
MFFRRSTFYRGGAPDLVGAAHEAKGQLLFYVNAIDFKPESSTLVDRVTGRVGTPIGSGVSRVYTEGRVALRLNGTSYVDFGTEALLGGRGDSIVVAVCARMASGTSGYHTAISQHSGAVNRLGWYVGVQSYGHTTVDYVGFGTASGVVSGTTGLSAISPDKFFTQASYILDSGTASYYASLGTKSSGYYGLGSYSANRPQLTPADPARLLIGANHDSGTNVYQYFAGDIEWVAVWAHPCVGYAALKRFVRPADNAANPCAWWMLPAKQNARNWYVDPLWLSHTSSAEYRKPLSSASTTGTIGMGTDGRLWQVVVPGPVEVATAPRDSEDTVRVASTGFAYRAVGGTSPTLPKLRLSDLSYIVRGGDTIRLVSDYADTKLTTDTGVVSEFSPSVLTGKGKVNNPSGSTAYTWSSIARRCDGSPVRVQYYTRDTGESTSVATRPASASFLLGTFSFSDMPLPAACRIDHGLIFGSSGVGLTGDAYLHMYGTQLRGGKVSARAARIQAQNVVMEKSSYPINHYNYPIDTLVHAPECITDIDASYASSVGTSSYGVDGEEAAPLILGQGPGFGIANLYGVAHRQNSIDPRGTAAYLTEYATRHEDVTDGTTLREFAVDSGTVYSASRTVVVTRDARMYYAPSLGYLAGHGVAFHCSGILIPPHAYTDVLAPDIGGYVDFLEDACIEYRLHVTAPGTIVAKIHIVQTDNAFGAEVDRSYVGYALAEVPTLAGVDYLEFRPGAGASVVADSVSNWVDTDTNYPYLSLAAITVVYTFTNCQVGELMLRLCTAPLRYCYVDPVWEIEYV